MIREKKHLVDQDDLEVVVGVMGTLERGEMKD